MARSSTVGSIVSAGLAGGATWLFYSLGLSGAFGADVQAQMQQIHEWIADFSKKRCPENDTRGVLGPDTFVYRVKWRGQIVYRSTVRGFAQKKYDELCQSDSY